MNAPNTASLCLCGLLAACSGGSDAEERRASDVTRAEIEAAPLGADNRPKIGRQIDRQGRAVIIGTLINQFTSAEGARGDKTDLYNEAAFGAWSVFTQEFEISLGIWDAFNADCTDQWLQGTGDAPYRTLAELLIDDRIYVDSASDRCGGDTYLGVEREHFGQGEGGCGGRTPDADIVDITYSLLIYGTRSGAYDALEMPEENAAIGAFPWLAPPTLPPRGETSP